MAGGELIDALLQRCRTLAPSSLWRNIGRGALRLGEAVTPRTELFLGVAYDTRLVTWYDENERQNSLQLRDLDGEPGPATLTLPVETPVIGPSTYTRYIFHPDRLTRAAGSGALGELIVMRAAIDPNNPPSTQALEAQMVTTVLAGGARPRTEDPQNLCNILANARPQPKPQPPLHDPFPR